MSLPVPSGSVYKDSEDKRRRESRNGVVQAAYVVDLIEQHAEDGSLRLTPEIVKELQRLAVNQIYRCAGYFRDGPVTLEGVEHRPPDHTRVAELVGELCAYLNQNWEQANAVHLAAYVMWRLNWIHPFFGGNGRTSRTASYLVLSARLRCRLPGDQTIPELIVRERTAYQAALRHADDQWSSGRTDVSKMEELLSSLLAEQLLSVHQAATGGVAAAED